MDKNEFREYLNRIFVYSTKITDAERLMGYGGMIEMVNIGLELLSKTINPEFDTYWLKAYFWSKDGEVDNPNSDKSIIFYSDNDIYDFIYAGGSKRTLKVNYHGKIMCFYVQKDIENYINEVREINIEDYEHDSLVMDFIHNDLDEGTYNAIFEKLWDKGVKI